MKLKYILSSAIVIICVSVTSCNTAKLKDADGNVYKTVSIGKQIWMAENLRTTKYNDGTEIPLVTDNDEWTKTKSPAYSWYFNNKDGNKVPYGALYNWYTVSTRKLCPAGWHVPTYEDWTALTNYSIDFTSIGGKLKEAGTEHWKVPNTGATNETGFTALPGGYRSVEGVFNSKGIAGYWWSTSNFDSNTIMFWNLRYKFNTVFKFNSEKYCGFSVRCLKDK
jgi:uncharacterized protein (TIGR02145 family)